MLAVMTLLFCRSAPAATVVAPTTASTALDTMASRRGSQVIRTKSDERSLVQGAAGVEQGVAMAGDLQGHFLFPRFQCAFDGVSALAILLELLAQQDVSLRQAIESVPAMHVEHRQVPCSWERKGEVMRLLSEAAEGARADFTDGIKLFEPEGWVLYLPDAVEPAFHVYVEATSPDELARLLHRSQSQLHQLGAGVA
ncbi:MAG: hypothetical protein FJX77_09420 [Armatimonadetes bacterium]|nr:hypothetical protein [Armatimonadota bacterium]